MCGERAVLLTHYKLYTEINMAHVATEDEIKVEEDVEENEEDEIDLAGFDRVICIGVDGSPQAELAFRSKWK